MRVGASLQYCLSDGVGLGDPQLESDNLIMDYGIQVDPAYPMFHYIQACNHAELNELQNAMRSLRTAFRYKGNVLAGESLPSPRADDSFKRYLGEPTFQKLLAELEQ